MTDHTPDPTIRVLGGPSVLIEYAGLRILTDPTFDQAGEYEVGPGQFLAKTRDATTTVDQVGTLDAILLSHDEHPDNLDRAGRAMLPTAPVVLTTPSGAQRLGGNAVGMALWSTREITGAHGQHVTITAVPAQHEPAGCEPYMGEVIGFVLTSPGQPTVYVSGDNASLEVTRDIATKFAPVDTAIIFAGAVRTPLFDGALLTMNGEQAAQAAQTLGAKHVVAAHVDSWGHFTEGYEEFEKGFHDAGLGQLLSRG